MNAGDTSGLPWDDVVDVVCAGAGPGVLAYAISAAERAADVLFAAVGAGDDIDPETAEYLSVMTEDLAAGRPADLSLPVMSAEPVVVATARRGRIQPFIGTQMRDFSAQCAASVFGVLHTEPSAGRTPLRVGDGEILGGTFHADEIGDFRAESDRPGPALVHWLGGRAGELGVECEPEVSFERLIFDAGRVVGAAVTGPSGTRLVRAIEGVVLATKPVPGDADWPACPELRDARFRVAMVSQAAGRFGRVALLTGPDSA